MKKRRKSGADRRQQSVDKGWHLVQNYRKEDPERHLEDAGLMTPDAAGRNPFEAPPMLRAEVVTYQKEVVSWLEFAMVSWLTFYFAIGTGSAQERLEEASEGLHKAAERLGDIARQMRGLPWSATGWHDLTTVYSEAVEVWSTAVDLVARAAEFDRRHLAEQGVEKINAGSATAEKVVSLHLPPTTGVDLDGSIRKLRRLEPPGKVSAKAVAKAKEPWERALVAAASRLNWSAAPW